MKKCDICGHKSARVQHITRTYGKGCDLVVIEGIPMMSCSNCGEKYFTAETLQEIERLKLHRKSLAVRKPVGVLQYACPPSS